MPDMPGRPEAKAKRMPERPSARRLVMPERPSAILSQTPTPPWHKPVVAEVPPPVAAEVPPLVPVAEAEVPSRGPRPPPYPPPPWRMKRQGCGWSPFENDRWTADEVEQYWSEAADEAADDTGGRSSEDEKVATNDDSSDDSWGPWTAADWSENKVDDRLTADEVDAENKVDDRWTADEVDAYLLYEKDAIADWKGQGDRWTADDVEKYWSTNKVDEKDPRSSSSMKEDANEASASFVSSAFANAEDATNAEDAMNRDGHLGVEGKILDAEEDKKAKKAEDAMNRDGGRCVEGKILVNDEDKKAKKADDAMNRDGGRGVEGKILVNIGSMTVYANDAEEKKAKKATEAADVRKRKAAEPHRKAMEYKAAGRLAKSGDRTMGLPRALLVVEHLSYASLMSLALLPRNELPARLQRQRRRKVDDADDDAGGDGADDDGSESVDGGVTTEEYEDEGDAKRAKPRPSKAKKKLK